MEELTIKPSIKNTFDKLLNFFWQKKFPQEKSGSFLEFSKPLSKVARSYEWLRNIIDIKEEHLLRRNAIFRVLRREVVLEGRKNNLALNLLKEMIAGGYVPEKSVLEEEVSQYEQIIQKYLFLIEGLSVIESKQEIDWWLSVASVEIDNKLSPKFYQQEKLISKIVLTRYKELVSNYPKDLSEKDLETLLYLSILKIIFKYDKAVLQERLLNYYLPNWNKVSDLSEISKEDIKSLQFLIEEKINHPYLVKTNRFVKKYALVFWLLGDSLEEASLLSDSFEEFKQKILNKQSLGNIVERAYFKRLSKSKEKLSRLTIRSIVFLLLTKTILALIFELPYDVYVVRQTNFYPLMANILFHPILLGVLALSFSKKKPQVELAKESVWEMFFVAEKEKLVLPKKIVPLRSQRMEELLRFFWAISFFLVFGFIIFILYKFDFNVVSIFFFLFFLTLVSYLGWRARNIVQEIVVVQEKASFLNSFLTFFSLPIIKIGERLSTSLPNLNVFIFLMDFIIETPFKALLKGLEEWFGFLKEKKEEIQT